MKKIIFIIITILFVGCGALQPKNTIMKESKLISVTVPQATGYELKLNLENKTNEIVEVLLSESTINNKPIYDSEEIVKVNWSKVEAGFNNAANSVNNLNTAAYGAAPKPQNNTTSLELTNRSSNIILVPNEKIEKNVGDGTNIQYPIKVVIKAKQNNYIDYSLINLTLEDIK